jgi:toxin HigB-1
MCVRWGIISLVIHPITESGCSILNSGFQSGVTTLRFKFKSKKIEALYEQEKDAHKYPNVIDDFFEVISAISAASDERDLYALRGLRFEKLKGQRGKKGERSLRLNQQWRLIIALEKDKDGSYLLIIDIEDYH